MKKQKVSSDEDLNIRLTLHHIVNYFPLSGSDHPDKYLCEIGHRSQML